MSASTEAPNDFETRFKRRWTNIFHMGVGGPINAWALPKIITALERSDYNKKLLDQASGLPVDMNKQAQDVAMGLDLQHRSTPLEIVTNFTSHPYIHSAEALALLTVYIGESLTRLPKNRREAFGRDLRVGITSGLILLSGEIAKAFSERGLEGMAQQMTFAEGAVIVAAMVGLGYYSEVVIKRIYDTVKKAVDAEKKGHRRTMPNVKKRFPRPTLEPRYKMWGRHSSGESYRPKAEEFKQKSKEWVLQETGNGLLQFLVTNLPERLNSPELVKTLSEDPNGGILALAKIYIDPNLPLGMPDKVKRLMLRQLIETGQVFSHQDVANALESLSKKNKKII